MLIPTLEFRIAATNIVTSFSIPVGRIEGKQVWSVFSAIHVGIDNPTGSYSLHVSLLVADATDLN